MWARRRPDDRGLRRAFVRWPGAQTRWLDDERAVLAQQGGRQWPDRVPASVARRARGQRRSEDGGCHQDRDDERRDGDRRLRKVGSLVVRAAGTPAVVAITWAAGGGRLTVVSQWMRIARAGAVITVIVVMAVVVAIANRHGQRRRAPFAPAAAAKQRLDVAAAQLQPDRGKDGDDPPRCRVQHHRGSSIPPGGLCEGGAAPRARFGSRLGPRLKRDRQ